MIEAENLPAIFGGTCECPGSCIDEDVGPWDDYVMVKPLGIKHKNDPSLLEEEVNGNALGGVEEEKHHEEPIVA
jgi:hypothetical protein